MKRSKAKVERVSGRRGAWPRPLGAGAAGAEASRSLRVDKRSRAAKELAVYVHRLRVVQDVERFGIRAAARNHGLSVTTVWRWFHAWEASGPDGLRRRYDRCGRIPYAALFDAREIAIVQRAYRDEGRMTAALRALRVSPLCSNRIRGLIDRLLPCRNELPSSIRDLIQARGKYRPATTP